MGRFVMQGHLKIKWNEEDKPEDKMRETEKGRVFCGLTWGISFGCSRGEPDVSTSTSVRLVLDVSSEMKIWWRSTELL